MNELILDGSWTLFSCENPSQKIPAVLPGDNYSALVNAGLCPDPYYGKNELEIQKFRYESWNWERHSPKRNNCRPAKQQEFSETDFRS